MSAQLLGVILGGVVPAILFASMALLAKASTEQGTGVGIFMISVSAGVGIVGLFALKLLPLRSMTLPGVTFAFLGGLSWALGAALIAFALLRFNVPIAKLGPLHNTSALIVAIGGLLLFREGQHSSVWQLLFGALLILLGGILVARA